MLPTAAEEALKAPTDTVEEEAGTRALDSRWGLLCAKRAKFHKTRPVPGDFPAGRRGENLLVHHRKRLTTYLLANEFIDPSVQKGGVPGYSGCLEHTAVISQLINEAKSNNNTLSVVWLDLAKAYPSVPHQLIRNALDHYRVPSEVVELVMAHMDALQMRFTVGSVTTKWQRLEKGIMAGCTISVALFIAAMNLLLKAGGMQCRGPKADDGTRHPACRAFMDDVTVMTPSIQGTQWILSALERWQHGHACSSTGKVKEPQYLEGEANRKHLQYPRLWDPNNPRSKDPMPWKAVRQLPKGQR